MAIFDKYISNLSEYIEQMRAKGRPVREFACPVTVDQLSNGLPVRVGPGANAGIILRSDTFVELGNPEAGSSFFTLWTDKRALLKDGRVTLIGPDIPQSSGASLPFGQVLVAAGKDISREELHVLEQNQFVADQIEGYMIRSASGLLWSRVSKDAAGKGFSFETLGRALMHVFKSAMPKIEAMEVLFVTSAKEDLKPLDDIGAQVRKISAEITKEVWKAKGIDIVECTLGWDCNSCSDKPVCDEIKELITVHKKKDGQPSA